MTNEYVNKPQITIWPNTCRMMNFDAPPPGCLLSRETSPIMNGQQNSNSECTTRLSQDCMYFGKERWPQQRIP